MLAKVLAIAEAVEGAEESLEVLPAPDELLWGSLAFGILAILMIKFVFPKLRQALEERSQKIQGQIEEAERVKREADQVLEQYRTQLAEARAEVQKIIEEGKRTADALRQDLVAKAEQQAQEIVAKAQADVAGERDRAMQQLRTTLGELSIQLASRVIEKELSGSEAHRALVDRAITEVAGSGNGHGGAPSGASGS